MQQYEITNARQHANGRDRRHRVAKKALILAIAAVLSLSVGAESFAESGKGSKGDKGACHDDRERLCGESANRQTMRQCMKEHFDELSPGCQDRANRHKRRMAETKAACESETESLCQDVKGGGKHMIRCLKQHKNELGDQCRTALKKHKKRKHKAQKGAQTSETSDPDASMPDEGGLDWSQSESRDD